MGKFRLLSKREVFGNNRLDIFTKIDRACVETSFAKLFGGYSTEWWLSSTSFERDFGALRKRISIVDSHGNSSYSYRDNDSDIKIRPIMKYSNLQQFKKSIQTNDDGVIEVEYGEYPQEQVPKELCDKLEKILFTEGQDLKKTGKKYTVRLGYIDDNKESVPPMQLTEYEYEGKKYVRCGKGSWFEVSPIKWYVDETKKILISKKLLIGNVFYKDIPKFLNTYFAEEIIVKKPKKEENKTDTNEKKEDLVSSNGEISSIERLINEIHKYLEGNPNKDAIIAKIVEMVNEYNSKLDNIGVMAEKNMPSLDTYDSVTNAFELKLETMLMDVKKHHEAFKEYFKMLTILDKYIALVNDNPDEEYTDGLVEDLDVINTMCLPFLKVEDANEIRKQLINVFNNEKKEITNYINGKGEVSYKTIDEMVIDLRRKIHPVLENLSTSVNKRDIEMEIRTSVSKIIGGLLLEPKNEALSFYLVEINNVYTNINTLIDKLPSDMKSEYKREILDIMNMEIDYTSEFNNIANDLKTMWLSLNKVLCRINGYLEKVEQIRSGHIDVNKIKR